MKTILAILLWCVMLFILMVGICEEQGLRELKYKHRRQYNAWMEERALNQHVTAKEAGYHAVHK